MPREKRTNEKWILRSRRDIKLNRCGRDAMSISSRRVIVDRQHDEQNGQLVTIATCFYRWIRSKQVKTGPAYHGPVFGFVVAYIQLLPDNHRRCHSKKLHFNFSIHHRRFLPSGCCTPASAASLMIESRRRVKIFNQIDVQRKLPPDTVSADGDGLRSTGDWLRLTIDRLANSERFRSGSSYLFLWRHQVTIDIWNEKKKLKYEQKRYRVENSILWY